jgi:hypothetical protein
MKSRIALNSPRPLTPADGPLANQNSGLLAGVNIHSSWLSSSTDPDQQCFGRVRSA